LVSILRAADPRTKGRRDAIVAGWGIQRLETGPAAGVRFYVVGLSLAASVASRF